MKRKIYAGTTSVELPIFVRDSTSSSGGGLAGLVYNTSGLVAEYRRQGQSSWQPITLVAGTLGTFASGAFVADGTLAGAYALCPPDAALVAGARWVAIRLRGATNMVPCLVEIELDAVNYQDAAGFGLTRLDASISSVVTAIGGVAAAVWAYTTRTLSAFGFTVAPTATQVTDAVLNATATSYNTAGSIGNKINAAASAGDPWSTTLPGSYTSGQAGNVVAACKTALDAINAFIANGQVAGFVNGGTPTQTTFIVGGAAATRGTVLDCWKDRFVVFTTGLNQGLAEKVTGFNQTTKAITTTAFPFAVADTDEFTIQGEAA
jgi:hypothetical protein